MRKADRRETYPIEIVDRHIVALMNGGRALIDTGSPLSLGNGGKLRLLGRRYALKRDKIVNFPLMSEFVGTEVTALIGCDILSTLYVAIEWDKRRITLSDTPIEFGSIRVPVRMHYGLPVLQVKIGRKTIETFFDTAARICFFKEEMVERQKSLGTIEDFHPLTGRFSSPLYEMTISVAGSKLTVNVGIMPEEIQGHLDKTGVENLIGNDIFRYFDICLELPDNEICLKKKKGCL